MDEMLFLLPQSCYLLLYVQCQNTACCRISLFAYKLVAGLSFPPVSLRNVFMIQIWTKIKKLTELHNMKKAIELILSSFTRPKLPLRAYRSDINDCMIVG